ncbi:MAG: sialate O-acetylesterase [Flavobacteriaceae bacterium]
MTINIVQKKIVTLLVLVITYCTNAQQKDVFLLIGQSNMAGRGDFETPMDSTAIANVFLLNDKGEFEIAKNPLNRYSTIRKVCEPELQGVGLGSSFAREMVCFLKDSVYLIVNARGGTPVQKFIKGKDDGYYETILNRTSNALQANKNLRLRAILWHQGESNASNTKDYLRHLNLMIESFRKDLNMPELPFIVGELGEWNGSYYNVRDKIKQIPERIENSYLVSSQGLKNRDEHHFDTASYNEFGKRYAEICQKVIYTKK